MSLIYRRGNGSALDPSLALTDLARRTLELGPEARISVMQVACGCPEPGCGDVETQITFTRERRDGIWERLRIGKPMRDITPEDLRTALAQHRPQPKAVAS